MGRISDKPKFVVPDSQCADPRFCIALICDSQLRIDSAVFLFSVTGSIPLFSLYSNFNEKRGKSIENLSLTMDLFLGPFSVICGIGALNSFENPGKIAWICETHFTCDLGYS